MAKGSYKKAGSEKEQKELMIRDIKGLFEIEEHIISEPARQNVLDEISWKYTETGKGKNLCCKYWSEKAIDQYKKNIENNEEKDKNKGLVHEHVIPRDIFINTILKMIKDKSNTEIITKEELDKRLIACVITKEEDEMLSKKTMPGKDAGKGFFDIKDIWGRYKKTGIKVFEVELERKRDGRKIVSKLNKKEELIIK